MRGVRVLHACTRHQTCVSRSRDCRRVGDTKRKPNKPFARGVYCTTSSVALLVCLMRMARVPSQVLGEAEKRALFLKAKQCIAAHLPASALATKYFQFEQGPRLLFLAHIYAILSAYYKHCIREAAFLR